MPKKKKRRKTKTKSSKKKKTKKKIYTIKKKYSYKKKKEKNVQDSQATELILKTKPEWLKSAFVNKSKYQKKYNESIKNNNSFWKKEGKRITWIKPYKKIKDAKYSKNEVRIKWYEDGTLNASQNCIDRHLKDKKDKTAIIWVGDDQKIHKNFLQTTSSKVSKLQMV